MCGEGNGTPLQYSCLENPMDGGAWWATVHGVAKSWTWLSDFTFTFHFHALEKEMATHSSVIAWRIPGTGESGGLTSMGSHRVGHDWSDLAAAAVQDDANTEAEASFCWWRKLLSSLYRAINLVNTFFPPSLFPNKRMPEVCFYKSSGRFYCLVSRHKCFVFCYNLMSREPNSTPSHKM